MVVHNGFATLGLKSTPPPDNKKLTKLLLILQDPVQLPPPLCESSPHSLRQILQTSPLCPSHDMIIPLVAAITLCITTSWPFSTRHGAPRGQIVAYLVSIPSADYLAGDTENET